MPISEVLPATVYDVTPYSPIVASSNASPPNSVVSREIIRSSLNRSPICSSERLELHHGKVRINPRQRPSSQRLHVVHRPIRRNQIAPAKSPSSFSMGPLSLAGRCIIGTKYM